MLLRRRVKALEAAVRSANEAAAFAATNTKHADERADKALDTVRALERRVDEWTGRFERQVRRLRMAYYIEPANAELLREIRRVGEIPGPSFGIPPEEAQKPAG